MLVWWIDPAAAAPPLDAVVLVVEGSAACAGALIDANGTIATAYHCVASGGRPQIETRDGHRTLANVIGVDRANDLALLSAPELAGRPWLALRISPIEVGEEAWALGHPMGARPPAGFLAGTLRWSASQGVVSAVGDRAIQVTAPVNPGNSGGPIVDAAGLMIGVVSRRIGGDGLGFAARIEFVQDLLQAEPRGLSPFGGTLSAELVGWSWGADDGALSFGGQIEIAMRDRLVLSALAATPWQGKWDAQRFGSVSWMASEARLAVRQRVFRGPIAMRFDVYGGRTVIARLDADDARGPTASSTSGWALGGAWDMPGVGMGFDVARVWLPEQDPEWRVGLVFTWPGTFWMF